jgi:hypothetical protein
VVPTFLWSWFGLSSHSPQIAAPLKEMRAFFTSLMEDSKDIMEAYDESKDEHFGLNVLQRLMISLEKGEMTKEEVYGEM